MVEDQLLAQKEATQQLDMPASTFKRWVAMFESQEYIFEKPNGTHRKFKKKDMDAFRKVKQYNKGKNATLETSVAKAIHWALSSEKSSIPEEVTSGSGNSTSVPIIPSDSAGSLHSEIHIPEEQQTSDSMVAPSLQQTIDPDLVQMFNKKMSTLHNGLFWRGHGVQNELRSLWGELYLQLQAHHSDDYSLSEGV